MLLHKEEMIELDKQIYEFMEDCAEWDMEKIVSMGVAHYIAYFYAVSHKIHSALSEQNELLKELISVVKSTQKIS